MIKVTFLNNFANEFTLNNIVFDIISQVQKEGIFRTKVIEYLEQQHEKGQGVDDNKILSLYLNYSISETAYHLRIAVGSNFKPIIDKFNNNENNNEN